MLFNLFLLDFDCYVKLYVKLALIYYFFFSFFHCVGQADTIAMKVGCLINMENLVLFSCYFARTPFQYGPFHHFIFPYEWTNLIRFRAIIFDFIKIRVPIETNTFVLDLL